MVEFGVFAQKFESNMDSLFVVKWMVVCRFRHISEFAMEKKQRRKII